MLRASWIVWCLCRPLAHKRKRLLCILLCFGKAMARIMKRNPFMPWLHGTLMACSLKTRKRKRVWAKICKKQIAADVWCRRIRWCFVWGLLYIFRTTSQWDVCTPSLEHANDNDDEMLSRRRTATRRGMPYLSLGKKDYRHGSGPCKEVNWQRNWNSEVDEGYGSGPDCNWQKHAHHWSCAICRVVCSRWLSEAFVANYNKLSSFGLLLLPYTWWSTCRKWLFQGDALSKIVGQKMPRDSLTRCLGIQNHHWSTRLSLLC